MNGRAGPLHAAAGPLSSPDSRQTAGSSSSGRARGRRRAATGPRTDDQAARVQLSIRAANGPPWAALGGRAWPVPRVWMVAIAARVLDAYPGARIEWAE